MAQSLSTRRYSVDWPHLAFLCVIGGATLWYLRDAISVSTSANNLLLVAPLSGLALALAAVLAIKCFQPQGKVEKAKTGGMKELGASELRSSDWRALAKIAGVAAALGAYVFLLDVIGFDVSTWLFTIAVMLLCGERRPLVLVIYPLIVAGLLIGGFRAMLPFPMYTLLF